MLYVLQREAVEQPREVIPQNQSCLPLGLTSMNVVWFTEGGGGAAKGGNAPEPELSPSRLDLKVGKIISVEKVRIGHWILLCMLI